MDDETSIDINGVVVTGWKAGAIILLILAAFVGLGFNLGHAEGEKSVCAGQI